MSLTEQPAWHVHGWLADWSGELTRMSRSPRVSGVARGSEAASTSFPRTNAITVPAASRAGVPSSDSLDEIQPPAPVQQVADHHAGGSDTVPAGRAGRTLPGPAESPPAGCDITQARPPGPGQPRSGRGRPGPG
jgi:hypothetical protein